MSTPPISVYRAKLKHFNQPKDSVHLTHLCHRPQQFTVLSIVYDFQMVVLVTTFGKTQRWDR
jgi:hypothetical protein